LLNDGAILSIAYDNVHYKDQPEAWNMRMVLGIATVLGVIGVVSAFGLFYLGERVFHLDRAHIQTLMYLKLSVAGHLTIFLTRTRGPFWSIRPAKILWGAVLGTQIVATLIAVYGLFMTPLGWGWAGFVWGYALLWFLVNDRIKLLAYRTLDPIKLEANIEPKNEVKDKAQAETKADPQHDAKGETKPDPKAEAKPKDKIASPSEASSEAKPETKPNIATKPEVKSSPDTTDNTASDLTPQIAARAYELYERQGHRDGQSVQNWGKAEQEIRETQAKAEPKAETKPVVLRSEVNVEPKPDAKPTDEVERKPDAKAKTKPEPNEKSAADVSPQLVKRVHEFYEQLGREDVRAVQKLDQAKPEVAKDESVK